MLFTKVTIVGNSVALRVRPPEKYPDNLNYSRLLESTLNNSNIKPPVLIDNRSLGASTVYNVINHIDHFIQAFPDIYIINLGVVDASTREVPLWFYRFASSKKDCFLCRITRMLYRNVIIKMRPFLVKLRGKRSWIKKRKFKKYYNKLLATLLRETNAQIITLPINLADNRVEKELPGSRKKHQQYNEIIKKLSEKYNQYFVDLSDLEPQMHYPDGVHYNINGHQVVAERLSSKIKEILQNR